jgi:phosphorylase kinase alpha/beta subunit
MDERSPPLNARLGALLRDRYRTDDLLQLRRTLDELGTLAFSRFESGLFSASPAGADKSGYENVWVRDNVHVAYAQLVRGDVASAVGVARALLSYFHRYRRRLQDIIAGVVDPDDVSRRPHVRFDGQALREIASEKWAHAQNDALGYFVWLVSLLARRGALRLSPDEGRTLLLFARYFQAIRFWQDPDSGHWEEARKVSASSIGTVVAASNELAALLRDPGANRALADWRAEGLLIVDELSSKGGEALAAILPAECVERSPRLHRSHDGALVFLVHPLRAVDDAMAATLLADVEAQLSGRWGSVATPAIRTGRRTTT